MYIWRIDCSKSNQDQYKAAVNNTQDHGIILPSLRCYYILLFLLIIWISFKLYVKVHFSSLSGLFGFNFMVISL